MHKHPCDKQKRIRLRVKYQKIEACIEKSKLALHAFAGYTDTDGNPATEPIVNLDETEDQSLETQREGEPRLSD